MKPSRLFDVLEKLLGERWPVFIWGPPGVGKSSVVRQIAERRSLPLLDVRASLLDPTDLRGIPSITDGRAVWCPPSFLPGPDQEAGILFFDELNAAPPLVQASLYQLTLDRRVGEYTLPDGWRIIAAGNREQDRAITFRMPSALSNRFVHLDFEVDFDDWRAWANQAGIDPLVVGFLGTRRELLNSSSTDRAFATPRSWQMVSDTIGSLGHSKDTIDILAGIVGEGAAVEFLAYCDRAISEEQIKKIIAAPTNARLPKKLGDQYALISYLAVSAMKPKVLKASGTLLGRLSTELAVLLARDVLAVNPSFARNTGFRKFIQQHKQLIA